MKGLLLATNAAGTSWFSTFQFPVYQTRRMYFAASQLKAAATFGLRASLRIEDIDYPLETGASAPPSSSANCIACSLE